MTKAMVVDDSRAMRMILAKALAECGFDVVQATNGRDALEQLERAETVPEFATVDWNMPEVTGIEFVRTVRASPRFGAMRLLMVTTETEVEQMALALEAGADEYLMKPFTRDTIQDKLRLIGVPV